MTRFHCALVTLILLFLVGRPAAGQQSLSIISFNVESDADTRPDLVANDIAAIGKSVDIFALSEVQDEAAAKQFVDAAKRANDGAAFNYLLSRTGGSDRLAIVYSASRLTLRRGPFEFDRGLRDFCPEETKGRQFRAPFTAEFVFAGDNRPFWLILNHLQRGNSKPEPLRNCQARFLNQLAKRNTLPMIAVGDFNYDWEIGMQEGVARQRDQGYDLMVADDAWRWLRPARLVKTQCAKNYNSVLDFVFVANRAKQWRGRSAILFPEESYCDRDARGYADHRPVAAQYMIPSR